MLKDSFAWENIENNGFLSLTSKMSAVRSRHRPPSKSRLPAMGAFFYCHRVGIEKQECLRILLQVKCGKW